VSTTSLTSDRPEGRHTMLRRKAQSVGGSAWSVSTPRVLFVTGSVAVPVGFLLMIFGWVGAARSVLIFDQLSYIASGGLIGLALVVFGGFMYFAYWQAMLLEHSRERGLAEARYRLELLERFDDLAAALLVGTSGSDAPVTSPGRTAATGTAFVVTETGSMLHRPDCPIVRDRPGLRPVTAAELTTLRPCRICQS
jgi:hypothetical protein